MVLFLQWVLFPVAVLKAQVMDSLGNMTNTSEVMLSCDNKNDQMTKKVLLK